MKAIILILSVLLGLILPEVFSLKNWKPSFALNQQLEDAVRNRLSMESKDFLLIASNNNAPKKNDGKEVSKAIEKITEEYSISKYPGALDEEKLAIYQQLKNSQTIDEIFQWVDEIPAIRNCYDRAMRISIATREDSFLAVTSLFKLANMLIALQHGNSSHLHNHHLSLDDYSFTADKTRRIEQLCECIELHISSLSIEELTKALWSVVTIDASEEYIQKLLMEYHDRIKCHKNQMKLLSYEDIALLIWTIGCVKDRYSTNSESLVDELIDVFIAKANQGIANHPINQAKRQYAIRTQQAAYFPTFGGGFGSTGNGLASNHVGSAFPTFDLFPPDFMGKILGTKLIVRMLWSLALHKNYQNVNINPSQLSFILEGLKTAIQHLSELTITNKVSLLWCCSHFHIHDKLILSALLKDLEQYIATSNNHFEGLTLYELKYLTEALCHMSHHTRRLYIDTKSFNDEMKNHHNGNNDDDFAPPPPSSSSSPSHSMFGHHGHHGHHQQQHYSHHPAHAHHHHLHPAPGHPQVSSPIAMLMAYHNHSPVMNETEIIEVLFEINQIMKLLIQQSISNRHEFFENPSMLGVIGLFEAATNIEMINYENEVQEFLSLCLQRFNQQLVEKFSARDAATIMEAMVTIADYPNLLNTATEMNEATSLATAAAGAGGDANKKKAAAGPTSDSSNQPAKKIRSSSVSEMMNFKPEWHELAGRLSVVCSLSANEIGDKSKIVATTWAVACLGHSYRPLYRVARRATQFTIHELSAKCLARLAVSIAKEEAASFATGGGMSVKLDHEFVDQIAINTLRRATEIESIKELIHAMTCIAFLGRLSSSGTKLQWASSSHLDNNSKNTKTTDESPDTETCALVDISRVAMKYLSTKQLIRIQWAIGRLPIGIFTSQTTNNLRLELEKRTLFSNSPDLLETKDKVAIQDTFLYVKTLTDSLALKDHKLDDLKDSICNALMSHCEILVNKNSSKSLLNYSLGKFSTYEKENFVMKLSILIDSLQSFIELNWFHNEMAILCSNYLQLISLMEEQEHISNIHTRCAIHFKLGILKELLKVYTNLSYKTTKRSQHHQHHHHPLTPAQQAQLAAATGLKKNGAGNGKNNNLGNKQGNLQHRHSLFSRFFTHN